MTSMFLEYIFRRQWLLHDYNYYGKVDERCHLLNTRILYDHKNVKIEMDSVNVSTEAYCITRFLESIKGSSLL